MKSHNIDLYIYLQEAATPSKKRKTEDDDKVVRSVYSVQLNFC